MQEGKREQAIHLTRYYLICIAYLYNTSCISFKPASTLYNTYIYVHLKIYKYTFLLLPRSSMYDFELLVGV